jgi:hypothetical protein
LAKLHNPFGKGNTTLTFQKKYFPKISIPSIIAKIHISNTAPADKSLMIAILESGDVECRSQSRSMEVFMPSAPNTKAQNDNRIFQSMDDIEK